jgi:MscS family membrane protein
MKKRTSKAALLNILLLLFAGRLFSEEAEAVKQAPFSLDWASYFPSWMQRELIGVSLWQFIAAFFFLLAGMVLKKISDHIFEQKLIPLFKKTKVDVDNLFLEAVSKPLGFLLLIGGIAVSLAILPLPLEPNVSGFVFEIVKIAFALDFLWFLFRLVDIGVKYLARLAERTESKLDEQLVPLVSRAIKFTIGAISFLWLMQLMGYNVSSLIAGLGIGGLAVALALQDTLSNFFGSVFIFLDRPFLVGDLIQIEDIEGTVEDIGFRSTRIRTYPATLVSIPNKTMANATIDNLSKRPKRRVTQTIGVTYETNADQMEKAVSAIKDIIEGEEGVDKEFIVVRFSDFGNSSLDIMVIYFTRDVNFVQHVEVKEKINLAIMRKLEEFGLSIAFPTRSIYIENLEKGEDLPLSGKKGKGTKKRNKEENLPF